MSLLDEFERVAHHIDNALYFANNTHDAAQVLDAVLCGKAQFWPVGEASVIVTEVVDYPQKSICRIWLAGGNMDELIEAEKDICEWAKEQGCSGMEIIGRKGWEKQLREYRSTSVVLTKEL